MIPSLPFSRWFFQSNQHVVRHHHGILHGRELSHHVGRAEVRVSLGRRPHGEKAYQMLGTQVHRLPNDLGTGSIGRRDSISIQNRWLYYISSRALSPIIPKTNPRLFSLQESLSPRISYLSRRLSWSDYSEYTLTSIISILAKSCSSVRRRT